MASPSAVRASEAVVAPVPPLARASVPPRVSVPESVMGPPVKVRPVVPPEPLMLVTVPDPPPLVAIVVPEMVRPDPTVNQVTVPAESSQKAMRSALGSVRAAPVPPRDSAKVPVVMEDAERLVKLEPLPAVVRMVPATFPPARSAVPIVRDPPAMVVMLPAFWPAVPYIIREPPLPPLARNSVASAPCICSWPPAPPVKGVKLAPPVNRIWPSAFWPAPAERPSMMPWMMAPDMVTPVLLVR